jgi:hypothetical protein
MIDHIQPYGFADGLYGSKLYQGPKPYPELYPRSYPELYPAPYPDHDRTAEGERPWPRGHLTQSNDETVTIFIDDLDEVACANPVSKLLESKSRRRPISFACLFSRFMRPKDYEALIGDLEEGYVSRRMMSEWRARLWFWRQGALSIVPIVWAAISGRIKSFVRL